MGTAEYVRLSELTDRTHRCKIKVRVSRRWTLGSKDSQEKKKRFDVVLIDEQGNQIQAIVPKKGSSEAHPEIPKYNFDFVEFNNIRLLPKENQNLQDVYGTLEGVSELMFRKGLMLKEIFLKNSSGTELKINLRENAIQLMDNVITYATSVSGVGCHFANCWKLLW
ncbi:hypothetical protein IFM89_016192 [Coptis chinensis]|uniref:Replication protein A 70 kDa DNA-binding subunit B/D first OB fold domain-containing protein n=1 Tax=Coptis chinensis TaxID=261450 RepID=A0A835IWZ7_9MAGN|nr:hypothetical protein IFM89_016192 [Coptis chinensis]